MRSARAWSHLTVTIDLSYEEAGEFHAALGKVVDAQHEQLTVSDYDTLTEVWDALQVALKEAR